MARVYYLAHVDKTDGTWSETFARHDENVRSFTVSQAEGDFCGLSVIIEKPSQALLDPARKQWVWLSMAEDATITPLFFGRVVGVPADLQNDFLTVEFLAKPADFEDQKRAVAATLRTAPFWDYAFIDPQMWEDPDATLEARTDVWHIDRITGEVSISSILQGEDGTETITPDLIPADGFSLTYGEAPLRRVQLEMRAMWTQARSGSLDITRDIVAAFKAAGSPSDYVTSYTGAGLYNDWPSKGDSIGNIYSFGEQTIEVADGTTYPSKYKTVYVSYDRAPADGEDISTPSQMKIDFRRWAFTINSLVDYSAEIERTEDIRFNVLADVQAVVNEDEDEQTEILTLSSGNVGAPVGPAGSTELPIGDVGRDTYFPSARGLQSIEFGLAHARALLMRRARAVEIKATVPLAVAINATCRKSATISHPGLSGGTATGKIVAYEFGVSGDDGGEFGSITIACMAGRNTAILPDAGTATYVSATYVGSDYQVFTGLSYVGVNGEMEYAAPVSDGVDPLTVGVTSCTVTGGQSAQNSVLSQRYIDIDAACDALNAVYTKVDLQMTPVDTSPRQLAYADSDVFLRIPQGVDLGYVVPASYFLLPDGTSRFKLIDGSSFMQIEG